MGTQKPSQRDGSFSTKTYVKMMGKKIFTIVRKKISKHVISQCTCRRRVVEQKTYQ